RRGMTIVEPEAGHLASGHVGTGRLASPQTIFSAMVHAARSRYDYAGRRVVVTAGGTREPIDPVRFISNYSSGKMGFALAAAAAASRRWRATRRWRGCFGLASPRKTRTST